MSTTIADQNEGKHSKTHGAIKPLVVLSFTSDLLRSHQFLLAITEQREVISWQNWITLNTHLKIALFNQDPCLIHNKFQLTKKTDGIFLQSSLLKASLLTPVLKVYIF